MVRGPSVDVKCFHLGILRRRLANIGGLFWGFGRLGRGHGLAKFGDWFNGRIGAGGEGGEGSAESGQKAGGGANRVAKGRHCEKSNAATILSCGSSLYNRCLR